MNRLQKQVLLLAIKAGEIMLSSGSEVYRVEDTIERICCARAMPCVDCLITTTVITASLGCSREGSEIDTIVRRIRGIKIDLERVSRIHTFVREFEKGQISVKEGFDILQRIEQTPHFTLSMRLLGVILTSIFFTLMSSGSIVDGLFSLFTGSGAYMLSLGLGRLKMNSFITVLASCFLCASLAFLCYLTGHVSSMSAIIIGGILPFMPGVAITNAARDLLSGDMLSGVARMVQSLLTSVAIAGGVGLLLMLANTVQIANVATQYPLPAQFIFGMLGTTGIAIFVNIPRRYLLLASLISACGWTVFQVLTLGGSPHVLACFAAVCVVGVIAEIITRLTKDAASLFIIPAIFPLVPGVGLYNTMLNLLEDDLPAAADTGVEAVLVAGSIAVALLVVISVTRVVAAVYRQIVQRAREILS